MDVDLYVRESGTGVPVVLLHAFPVNSAMWLAQREGLADLCRVITPDFRGFAGSPLGLDEPSLDVLADDIARLLDQRELDRVVLGGLSMGGYVAMAFVRRHALGYAVWSSPTRRQARMPSRPGRTDCGSPTSSLPIRSPKSS